MADFNNSTVNQRFKHVFQYLEKNNLIKGKSDIAKHLGTYNHVINSILKGDRNITIEQLNKLVELFGLNANYMFGHSDMMLLKSPSNVRGLSDFTGRQNIMLVRQQAIAGYAGSAQDPAYIADLPRFSIPGMEGELIAFQISGDSMLPTITSGDIVVCEAIERNEPIRESNVYIVVTDTVVAKRIHQVKVDGTVSHLELVSDNSIFRPYTVDLDEVKQILKIKTRLTNYGIE